MNNDQTRVVRAKDFLIRVDQIRKIKGSSSSDQINVYPICSERINEFVGYIPAGPEDEAKLLGNGDVIDLKGFIQVTIIEDACDYLKQTQKYVFIPKHRVAAIHCIASQQTHLKTRIYLINPVELEEVPESYGAVIKQYLNIDE